MKIIYLSILAVFVTFCINPAQGIIPILIILGKIALEMAIEYIAEVAWEEVTQMADASKPSWICLILRNVWFSFVFFYFLTVQDDSLAAGFCKERQGVFVDPLDTSCKNLIICNLPKLESGAQKCVFFKEKFKEEIGKCLVKQKHFQTNAIEDIGRKPQPKKDRWVTVLQEKAK